MDDEATRTDVLELMLVDANVEPKVLPLSLLRMITDNFSDDRKIGEGGFAVVYEGRLKNGTVAVKKLFSAVNMDEEKFTGEVGSLMKVRHKNIVRFLGYCADTQGEMWDIKGKNVMAEVRQRLLCFEFLPNGGLDRHINDTSEGLEWKARYQIIKGICEGLYYLHKKHIVHLDLKPANVLLNDNMVPKTNPDFGLSRCFDEKQTQTLTSKLFGTFGYMAPEFFNEKAITYKLDIYSLGVIILEILTGLKGYADVKDVLGSWKSRLKASEGDARLEQVKLCAEIGTECINSNPKQRPDAKSIIERLDELEHIQSLVELPKKSKLLDVHPLEIRFPFQPNVSISCPVTLINRKHCYAGIWITPIREKDGHSFPFYIVSRPGEKPCSHLFQIMEAQTTWLVHVAMDKRAERLSRNTYKFQVSMVISDSKEHLQGLNASMGDIMNNGTKFSGVKFIEEVLKVFICDRASPSRGFHELEPLLEQQDCFDVHPTHTWILVASYDKIRILNYQTQQMVTELMVEENDHRTGPNRRLAKKIHIIHSVKFIARKEWFAMGDDDGWVHVYTYTENKFKQFKSHEGDRIDTSDLQQSRYTYPRKNKIKRFKSYDRDRVDSLAIHPSQSYMMTASSRGDLIKLWDWSQNWKCIRTFNVRSSEGARHLTWNQSDTNIAFSYAGEDMKLMVYEVDSERSTPRFDLKKIRRAGFIDVDSHGHLLTTSSGGDEYDCCIRDWQTKETVHRLALGSSSTRGPLLACHPTLPIFVTAIRFDTTGYIQLWHATTYRLLNMFRFGDRIVDIIFTGTKDSARLVVRCQVKLNDVVSVIDIDSSLLRMVRMV